MSWASEELKKSDLGDKRRARRLVTIVEDLSAQPNASLAEACRDQAALQGVYDFWSNPRLEASSIITGHQESTLERVKEQKIVLAIQDTTELDFKNHRRKRGLGTLSSPHSKGLKVHSTLCVSSDGVPLGLIDQQVWARVNKRGSSSEQTKRAIEKRESNCWLKGLEITSELIPEPITVVTVADREADIFELLAQCRSRGSEFLIRAYHKRSVKKKVQDVERLHDAIAKVPVGYTLIASFVIEVCRN